MHKQVSGCTVNFGPNFPEYPFLESHTRIPRPHIWKTSDLDDQSLLWNTPAPNFGKLQIWDDQSLLRNTPPPQFWKTSDLGWPKFTQEYPPSPFRETSDLGWPKFTPEYPLPREFKNTDSYYMWRLYPTRITTRFILQYPFRYHSICSILDVIPMVVYSRLNGVPRYIQAIDSKIHKLLEVGDPGWQLQYMRIFYLG